MMFLNMRLLKDIMVLQIKKLGGTKMRHKIRKILVRFKIYPKCFSPCPPFYDVCNRQDLRAITIADFYLG